MEVVDDGDDMNMEVEVVSFCLLPVGVALLNDERDTVFGTKTDESVVGVAIDGGTTNDWTGCNNAAAAMTADDIIVILLILSG